MKSKAKDCFAKHIYMLCIFAFLLIYSFVVSGGCRLWQVDEYDYTLHVVDYSMGFCRKFIVGVLYGFFCGDYNNQAVSIYETVLTVLMFFGVAALCEKLILKTRADNRRAVIVLILFFLTGPCTFAIYIKQLGMYDVYWIYFSIMMLLVIVHKATVPLAVPLFALFVMVYYASMFCYVPAFLLLLVYKCSLEKSRGAKALYASVFIASTVVAVGLSLYFLINERSNLTYSMEEMNKILLSRGATDLKTIDGQLYRMTPEGEPLQSVYGSVQFAERRGSLVGYVLESMLQQLQVSFAAVGRKRTLPVLLLIAPVTAVFVGVIVDAIKNREKKSDKLILLCCPALSFFSLIIYSFQ